MLADTVVHPNVQFVLDGHDRLERGDTDAIAEMFSPDIVWHEFGTSELAGARLGIVDVMAFWKLYFAAAGDGFRQDILEIMASDSHVSTIVRLTGRKSGVTLDQTAVDIMQMNDGKIGEFWRYYANLAEAEAFFRAAK